jgi:hypothetical protein
MDCIGSIVAETYGEVVTMLRKFLLLGGKLQNWGDALVIVYIFALVLWLLYAALFPSCGGR